MAMSTLSISRHGLLLGMAMAFAGLAAPMHAFASGSDASGRYYSSGSDDSGRYNSSNGNTQAPLVVASESHDRYSFSPKALLISRGTKVVWRNKSDAEHNVTINSMKVNKDFKHEQSVNVTFSKAGTYYYQCEYHPYMKGTIVVK
jgi:plastocyanin